MKSMFSQVMTLTSDVKWAAIYARVSTEDQGKGFSIHTQIEACQQLATREGYTLPERHVVLDEGISGTTLDRPGLQRLRELVQTQAIAGVIVIDPDRLSRNLGHQLLLAEEFERAGVKLLIVSHPLERGPEGWLFFQMHGALAEYERAKLLERTQHGRIGRAKADHVLGGGVPYGYRYVAGPHQGTWAIDDTEAAVVRRIFDMYVQGVPIRGIVRQLTQERVPTAYDGPHHHGGYKRSGLGIWSRSHVGDVLKSPVYIGRASCGQKTRNHLDNSVYDLASAAALACMLPTPSCMLNADVSGTGGGGKAYGLEAIAGTYNRVGGSGTTATQRIPRDRKPDMTQANRRPHTAER